jgi:hypothetical protein
VNPHQITEFKGRKFDVQRSHPLGAARYPASAVLEPQPVVKRKAWLRGRLIDQAQEGACVGHGVTNELTASPVRVRFADLPPSPGVPRDPQTMAFWIYHEAQKDDEWAGEDYEGTSVNAGMRVARRLGVIDSWYWVSTRTEMRDAMIQKGPLVLAIPWYSGMYYAVDGVLKVSGYQVGWHCILANAYDPAMLIGGVRKERYRLLNSWGGDWGINGAAWIEADELWSLIADNDGEVVIPVGRSLT